jgi:hypothetical protein
MRFHASEKDIYWQIFGYSGEIFFGKLEQFNHIRFVAILLVGYCSMLRVSLLLLAVVLLAGCDLSFAKSKPKAELSTPLNIHIVAHSHDVSQPGDQIEV